ncbi:unnamed protein product [Durusdinium trenchii]|uniref:Uncharacterized protein n=1 Tax=Durusdinium trenchii TaxID=1381693 RepID=A0ABP0HKY1_9DINO
MKPRADGTYLVPEEIIKAWKDGNQDMIVEDFKSAGLDKELFVKKAMKKIVTRIRETDLWGDGSFMSEQDMKHEGFPEHRIKAIKAEAMRNKGWKQKLGCSGLQRLNEELSGKFNMAIKVEQFLLRRYLPSPSTKYLLVLAASQCSLNDFFFSMQLLDASKA